MLAIRFLSRLGGSDPLAIEAGLISDLWDADRRGRAVAVYTFLLLLGPALGPIAGGFTAQDTTWRWIFWASSIASCLFQLVAMIYLRDTYGPKILCNKARRLEKEKKAIGLHIKHDLPQATPRKKLRINLTRPVRLLATQVIIQFLALYMAYSYGIMFLVLSTFPSL